MTNPRDTGRYDATTDTWIDQQVRIDFAWGNIPIQPNDDRGEDTLDPELDSHIIATDGWSSFPEFEPNVGFDVQTVIVPNVVDFDSVSAAEEYLISVGLVLGTVTTSSAGATSQNNNWVKSQSPAASTDVPAGTAVNLVKYVYTAPPSINYNLAGIRPAVGLGSVGRTVYLNGGLEVHGINAQDLITLHDTGVANYNRQFTVFEIWPDDAFNTGGTRMVLRNVDMDGTGGDVTNVGTYTKP